MARTIAGKVVRRGAPTFLREPQASISWVLAVLLVFALVQGCDQAIKGRADLSETAKKYMDLRQRGQWEMVWDEYVDPALRNQEKRKVYMAKRRSVFDIEAFEVVSVAEKGTKGEVVVEIDAIVPVLKPGGGLLRLPRELRDTQQWVRKEGSWYIQLQG